MKDAANVFKLINNVDGLPTLPAIVIELDRLLRDYDTSSHELAGVIEKDQAIVPKILRLVNSAFFGLRTQISNIPHALMLLGYNTVRNAVVSVAVIDAIAVRKRITGFDIADFWTHAAAVAVISKYLAKETRLEDFENAFVAGLIHDIGKIILLQYFTDTFIRVWEHSQKEGMPFYDAEMKALGISHSEIGALIAKKWQLPDFLCHAIKYHHRVKTTVAAPELLMVVHCANLVANNINRKTQGSRDMKSLHPEAAALLRPLLMNIRDWLPEIEDEISAAANFFIQESKR